MEFHHPPTILFDDLPIPKRHPLISPRIHQKMRKGCGNDHIEAFGVVYWAKKLFQKHLRGLQQPPSEDEG